MAVSFPICFNLKGIVRSEIKNDRKKSKEQQVHQSRFWSTNQNVFQANHKLCIYVHTILIFI